MNANDLEVEPPDGGDELQPGAKLLQGQYTIDGYLSSGGFGITYMAKDSLDRAVVIKECFPEAFCRRSRAIVEARTNAHYDEFKTIVRLFVQEARSLSKLTHPNIVGVHQVFEDNETAYMAIDFINGQDLLDIIEEKQSMRVDEIVRILSTMLDAISYVHKNNMLHRDISPDNILIDQDREPILIDFGAAREEASKQSRALSTLSVVKDGYSPQEFYVAGSIQNESSDLYALGATFYHLITGNAPPNSQTRLSLIASGEIDPFVEITGRYKGYPTNFLEAIDKALQVLPRERLQTADEWLDMIDEDRRIALALEQAKTDAKAESMVAELIATHNGVKKKPEASGFNPFGKAKVPDTPAPLKKEAKPQDDVSSFQKHPKPKSKIRFGFKRREKVKAAPPKPIAPKSVARKKSGFLKSRLLRTRPIEEKLAAIIPDVEVQPERRKAIKPLAAESEGATAKPVEQKNAVTRPLEEKLAAIMPSAAPKAEPESVIKPQPVAEPTHVPEPKVIKAPRQQNKPDLFQMIEGDNSDYQVEFKDKYKNVIPDDIMNDIADDDVTEEEFLQDGADDVSSKAETSDNQEFFDGISAFVEEEADFLEEEFEEEETQQYQDTDEPETKPRPKKRRKGRVFKFAILAVMAITGYSYYQSDPNRSFTDMVSLENLPDLPDLPQMPDISLLSDTDEATLTPTPTPPPVERIFPLVQSSRPSERPLRGEVPLTNSGLEIVTLLSPENLSETSFGTWKLMLPFETQKQERNGKPYIAISSVNNNLLDVNKERWLQPGVELVSVNGISVATPADLQDLIDAVAIPEGGVPVPLRLGVRTSANELVNSHLLSFVQFRSVKLPNGLEFQSIPLNRDWTTIVSATPLLYRGELQIGDVILSEMISGVPINAALSLETLAANLLETSFGSIDISALRGEALIQAILEVK